MLGTSTRTVKIMAKDKASSAMKDYSSKGTHKSLKKINSLKPAGRISSFKKSLPKKGSSKGKILENDCTKENTLVASSMEKDPELHSKTTEFSKTRNIQSLKSRNISPNSFKEIGEKPEHEKFVKTALSDIVEDFNTSISKLKHEMTAKIESLECLNSELATSKKCHCYNLVSALEAKVSKQGVKICELENMLIAINNPTKQKGRPKIAVSNLKLDLAHEEASQNPIDIIHFSAEKPIKSRNEVASKQAKIQCTSARNGMAFEGRSMSLKTTFEGEQRLSNKTLEIENEIKEMKIVQSYEKKQGVHKSKVPEEPNLPPAEEGYITKLRSSSGMSDKRLTNYKSMKKCKSDKLIHFPTNLRSHKKRKSKNQFTYYETVRAATKHDIGANNSHRCDNFHPKSVQEGSSGNLQGRIMDKILSVPIHLAAKPSLKPGVPQTIFTLSKSCVEPGLISVATKRDEDY
ncbi:unnamed protein product [Moneuplotes crassus]|uniref:Uncharacterized protein n=1 Tax=Euplotes crassus TaxID=5936 RepID=A0AAD1XBD2_EUPCR|nr:unnamed protein product [Moneuplotes crassus]